MLLSESIAKKHKIIARSAFGLGINCPDIERVVNWVPPNALENLVQESGRAGQNRIPSRSILVYRNPG